MMVLVTSQSGAHHVRFSRHAGTHRHFRDCAHCLRPSQVARMAVRWDGALPSSRRRRTNCKPRSNRKSKRMNSARKRRRRSRCTRRSDAQADADAAGQQERVVQASRRRQAPFVGEFAPDGWQSLRRHLLASCPLKHDGGFTAEGVSQPSGRSGVLVLDDDRLHRGGDMWRAILAMWSSP